MKDKSKLNLHDQTFCHTASLRPEYAQDILKLKLRAEVLQKHFDLTSMQRRDTALHKTDASKILADVAYSVNVKDHLQALVTMLLLEHKSYPDQKAPLQIAQQVTRAYDDYDYVVPIIFSHADGPWKIGHHVKDDVRKLIGLGELSSPYFLVDWRQISDERLQQADLTAAAVWGTMKYRKQLTEFDKNVTEGTQAILSILRLFRRTQVAYRQELFSIAGGYMRNLNKALNVDNLGEIERQHIRPNEKPIIHEVMEFDPVKAREKGLKQGIQQGIQQGEQKGLHDTARRMLKANEDLDRICNFTGLSKQEVKSLTI